MYTLQEVQAAVHVSSCQNLCAFHVSAARQHRRGSSPTTRRCSHQDWFDIRHPDRSIAASCQSKAESKGLVERWVLLTCLVRNGVWMSRLAHAGSRNISTSEPSKNIQTWSVCAFYTESKRRRIKRLTVSTCGLMYIFAFITIGWERCQVVTLPSPAQHWKIFLLTGAVMIHTKVENN